MVLGHTDKAVVRWMLDCRKFGGKHYWEFRKPTSDDPGWRVNVIVVPEAWEVYDVKMVPGAAICEQASHLGLVLAAQGPGAPLLRHAAQNGFCNMSLFFLKKVRAVLCDIKFARGQTPKTELDWVRALAGHVLGQDQITPSLWEHMCFRRNKSAVSHELMSDCLLAQAGNDEVIKWSLHNLDLDEPVAELKDKVVDARKKEASVAVAASSGSAAAPSSSGPASSSSAALATIAAARRPVLIDYEVGDSISLDEARCLLPQCAGYGLIKDTTLHMRWQVKWKGPEHNLKYFSKGWGPRSEHSIRSALAWVLQEAWNHHKDRTGESCPHNFRAAL